MCVFYFVQDEIIRLLPKFVAMPSNILKNVIHRLLHNKVALLSPLSLSVCVWCCVLFPLFSSMRAVCLASTCALHVVIFHGLIHVAVLQVNITPEELLVALHLLDQDKKAQEEKLPLRKIVEGTFKEKRRGKKKEKHKRHSGTACLWFFFPLCLPSKAKFTYLLPSHVLCRHPILC